MGRVEQTGPDAVTVHDLEIVDDDGVAALVAPMAEHLERLERERRGERPRDDRARFDLPVGSRADGPVDHVEWEDVMSVVVLTIPELSPGVVIVVFDIDEQNCIMLPSDGVQSAMA